MTFGTRVTTNKYTMLIHVFSQSDAETVIAMKFVFERMKVGMIL